MATDHLTGSERQKALKFRSRRFSFAPLLMLLCFSASMTVAADAMSQSTDFNIGPQPVETALHEWSRQSHVQILVASDDISDQRTEGVKGRLTAANALAQLLQRTNLTYETVGDRTVTVKRVAAATNAEAKPASPQPVRRQETSEAKRDVEEVIVTAQKREERLQDVPISITALGSEAMDQASVSRVAELTKLVPNFSFESAFGSSDDSRMTIRGITGNVRNAGFESGVSVYIDGVYAGRPASQNLNLVDIERVEVLRGPQGTLFGRNTIAGAVNVITKKPGQELEGKVTANVGNFNKREFSGYISGPVAGDLSAGASFFSNDRDGYVKNFFDNRDLGTEGAKGGDIKLRYAPQNSDLDVNFRADYLEDDVVFVFPETLDGSGRPGVPGLVISPGIRTTNLNGIPRDEREVYGASLSADIGIGDYTLTSITAYRRSEFTHHEDNDNSPADYLFVDGWHELARYASQELRLTSPRVGKFDYLVGTYLSWQDVNADVPFRAGADYPAPGLATIFSNIETRGFALFAHATYHLSDQLTFAAGVRYTRDHKEVKDYHGEGDAFGGAFSFSRFTDERTDSDVSPMGSITYAFNDDMNVYGKVAKGFKSGGWNTDFIASADGSPPRPDEIDFDPEDATTYELGFKGSLLDRHVMLNVAAFHTDYKNLQVQSRVYDPRTDLFSYQFNNAATSTIKGVEVETDILLAEGLTLRGGVGYTDATYDSYKAAAEVDGVPVDYDGNRLPHVPKWNASLMASYERPVSNEITASISLNYAYKDFFFTDANNDPLLRVDSYGLLGGRVGIASERAWEVYLWGENLTDRDYLLTRLGGNNLRGTWGMPRSYGVQMSYSF